MSTATAVGFQVSATRGALLDGLRFVAQAVAGRTTLPVLTSTLVRAEPDGLTLTATDLDIFARIRVPADVQGDGAVCVPAKELRDLVANLPDGSVSLRLDGTSLQVSTRTGRYRLSGYDAVGFPLVPEIDFAAGWEVSRDLLGRVSKDLASLVADEMSRPILHNICWDRDGSLVRFSATMGHMLGRITAPAPDRFPDRELLVPPAALALAVALPGDGPIVVAAKGGTLGFSADAATAVVRLGEGTFPRVDQVIPKNNDKVAVVRRVALLAMVKRALVLAENNTYRIGFGFSADGLTFDVADARKGGEGSDATALESYDGEPIRIGFNGHYLLSLLAKIPHERVRLSMSEPLRSALLTADGDAADHLYLCMPLRLE